MSEPNSGSAAKKLFRVRAGAGFAAVLLAAMGLAAIPSAGAAADASGAATGGDYVALGDSYSLGFSASSPAKGFVGILYSEYRSSLGVDNLVDVAKAGESSDSLVNGGQLADAIAAINGPSDTKVVTIETGGADALLQNSCPGHWDDPGVCRFRANFANALDQLEKALAADPGQEPLIAMTYPNPSQGTGTGEEATRARALLGSNQKIDCSDSGAAVGLDDAIVQTADEHGVAVANPYPAFVKHGQSYWAQDDPMHLHPNDAGYAAMAASFDSAAGCDSKPPRTRITTRPANVIHKPKARYAFSSSEPGSTFLCSLDGVAPSPCSSPQRLKHLKQGRHTFTVAAVDAAGNRDRTPAKDAFRVKRKRRHRHRS